MHVLKIGGNELSEPAFLIGLGEAVAADSELAAYPGSRRPGFRFPRSGWRCGSAPGKWTRFNWSQAPPPLDYREPDAVRIFSQAEFRVHLDLGLGDGETTVCTCDLIHGYVTINADYRT